MTDRIIADNIELCRNLWLTAYPEEAPRHDFSEGFTSAMRPILRASRFGGPRRVKNVIRTAIIAAIMLTVAAAAVAASSGGTPMTLEAVLNDGTVTVTAEYRHYDRDPARSFELEHLPEGLSLRSSDWQGDACRLFYGRGDSAFFTVEVTRLSRRRLSLTYAADSFSTLRVGGAEAYVIDDGGQIHVIRRAENYVIVVAGAGLSEDELIKTARHVTLE